MSIRLRHQQGNREDWEGWIEWLGNNATLTVAQQQRRIWSCQLKLYLFIYKGISIKNTNKVTFLKYYIYLLFFYFPLTIITCKFQVFIFFIYGLKSWERRIEEEKDRQPGRGFLIKYDYFWSSVLKLVKNRNFILCLSV